MHRISRFALDLVEVGFLIGVVRDLYLGELVRNYMAPGEPVSDGWMPVWSAGLGPFRGSTRASVHVSLFRSILLDVDRIFQLISSNMTSYVVSRAHLDDWCPEVYVQ